MIGMSFLKKFYSFVAFAVLFGIFNLICFISRTEYTTSFYICLAFGNFSLLLCALTAIFSFAKRQKNLVYSYYYLTSIYEIIAVILNLIFVWTELENLRVNVAINSVLAAIFLILIFWSLAADADTNQKAKERTQKLNYHYDMCDTVRVLRGRGNGIKVNKKIEAFYDAVSNSQINADNESVYHRDRQIIEAARYIDGLLLENAPDEKIVLEITKAITLVDERNEYIKNMYIRGA